MTFRVSGGTLAALGCHAPLCPYLAQREATHLGRRRRLAAFPRFNASFLHGIYLCFSPTLTAAGLAPAPYPAQPRALREGDTPVVFPSSPFADQAHGRSRQVYPPRNRGGVRAYGPSRGRAASGGRPRGKQARPPGRGETAVTVHRFPAFVRDCATLRHHRWSGTWLKLRRSPGGTTGAINHHVTRRPALPV